MNPEFKRIRWLIGVVVVAVAVIQGGAVSPQSQFALIAHKFSVIALAAVLAHVVRSEMFPYLDLGRALRSRRAGEAIGSAIVVGLFMAAIILGVALGL